MLWLPGGVLQLGLIDELAASDELPLPRQRDGARIYEVSSQTRKILLQQLLAGLGFAARKAADFIAAKLRAL